MDIRVCWGRGLLVWMMWRWISWFVALDASVSLPLAGSACAGAVQGGGRQGEDHGFDLKE